MKEKNKMKISKKELEEGKYYRVMHKEKGDMICIYQGKSSFNNSKIRFKILCGCIEYRSFIDIKPSMAKYELIGDLE
jgi:hypothetical protein